MTPNGGILRRPRYSSSSSSSSAASATTNANDGDAVVNDVNSSTGPSSDTNNNSPHHHPPSTPPPSSPTRTTTTTMPIKNGGGASNRKYPPRSLAEMVKSVTDLNNEASLDFSSVNDIITNCDDCNVVQAKSTSAALLNGERRKHTTLHATDDGSDEHHDPLLLLSNDGTPYMNINNSSITSSSPNVDADNDDATVVDNTKNPIIAAAVGVVGDNGQGVRFCEYEQVSSDNDGGNKTMTTTTIRDRLGGDRNTIIDMDNPNVDTDVLKKGRSNNINDIDDDETADSDSESYGSGSNEGGDEDILHELGMANFFNNDNNDQDEEEDNVINDQHVRPFRVLWEILTRWATPSTVELVLTYQRIQQCEQQTLQQNDDIHHLGRSSNENMATVPRNDVDIGASRQAGIMSMIKMHVPRALAELQRIQQRGEVVVNVNNNTSSEEKNGMSNQKLVEQRLANLVRTFDPSVPAINLSTKLWKGLTTILIFIAFPSSDDNIVVLPPSILVLDMTAAEYRYLTCSVYTSLCSVD